MNAYVSFYANADYQLSIGDTDGGRRDGISGAVGGIPGEVDLRQVVVSPVLMASQTLNPSCGPQEPPRQRHAALPGVGYGPHSG
jgi:hypothetical protein